MRALEKGLNASFEFRRVLFVWQKDDVWDLTVGWMSSSLKMRELVQFIDTFRSVCFSICVPQIKVGVGGVIRCVPLLSILFSETSPPPPSWNLSKFLLFKII